MKKEYMNKLDLEEILKGEFHGGLLGRGMREKVLSAMQQAYLKGLEAAEGEACASGATGAQVQQKGEQT